MTVTIALKIEPPPAATAGGKDVGDLIEVLFLNHAETFPFDGSDDGKGYHVVLNQIVELEQTQDEHVREVFERAEDIYARLEGIAIRAFYRRGFRDAVKLLAEAGLGWGPRPR